MADNPDLDHRAALLHRVAKAIGVPAKAFYNDAPGDAGDLLTLMRLWSSIEDEQARQRILMMARQEFERSAQKTGSATERT